MDVARQPFLHDHSDVIGGNLAYDQGNELDPVACALALELRATLEGLLARQEALMDADTTLPGGVGVFAQVNPPSLG